MTFAKAFAEQREPLNPQLDVFDTAEFFEQIVALVPGIIYVFNHQKQVNEFSNHSIATLLGYSSAEIINMDEMVLPSIIHADDLPLIATHFAVLQTLGDGETADVEYRGIARDGSIVWLRSRDAVFQRAVNGSVLRHIGVANDVTEQISKSEKLANMNAELERRTRQLEQTNDELEQLAYIATHDLKSPVSNLSHLVQMLQDDLGTTTPQIKETIDWMHTSCRQANSKLEALVRVAQARSGDVGPPEEVDLAEATESVCDALMHEIKLSQADIQTDYSQATHLTFPRFEVTCMLENLIGNAIKYAHKDRAPKIHGHSAVDGGAIQIKVRDNGRGIALPRDAEKVFGLFKRAHVTPEGSGVALYTIRKMLQRCGGAITVDSVEGAWTEFTLTFPHEECR